MSGEKKDYDFMFKLILVGTNSVGKSNILLKFTKNEFSQSMGSTIGVEYATKNITTQRGNRIKLQIWDTCGQQKYHSLMKTYYRGASAVMIVYDITNEKSFLTIQNELKLLKEFFKGDIISMIVGNKIDLEEQRQISKQKGLELAENKRIAFYQVSAKDGTNINLIFTRIAEELEKAVMPIQKQSETVHQHEPNKDKIKKQDKPEEVIVINNKSEKKRIKENQKKKCCQ